jgi:hypothetical protein
MKAAHRKELEKNVLADRLGQLAGNIRKRPQRRTVLVVLGIVVALGIFLAVSLIRKAAREDAAENWVKLDDGYREYIQELIRDQGDANVGKAARFEYAWLLTWDGGIKRLAADPVGALKNLKDAEKTYGDLASACAGDPVWEAEAMYGQAVIEETRAVKDKKHLDKARELYAKLGEKHGTTVHGARARKRAEQLKDKSTSRLKIEDFYQELHESLPQLRAEDAKHPQLPFGIK